MFVGVHGDYHWELGGGELRVLSADPLVGYLRSFESPASFNNEEQATWFAQGRIDTHLDELRALTEAARLRDG